MKVVFHGDHLQLKLGATYICCCYVIQIPSPQLISKTVILLHGWSFGLIEIDLAKNGTACKGKGM